MLLLDQRDALAQRVAELQATLDKLNAKIARYDSGVAVIEKDLSL